MCTSTPKPPQPVAPLPPAPAPEITSIESATGASRTQATLSANRGRSRLRIDRTQSPLSPAGSGLNIPN